MKAVKKLVSMLSLGVLLGTAVSAAPFESYLETAKTGPGVPVPVSVVAPDAYGVESGSEAYLTFTVDEQGVPQEIEVKSATSDTLAANAVKAVAKWRFTPAMVEGKAVATKVALPVVVRDPLLAGTRVALK